MSNVLSVSTLDHYSFDVAHIPQILACLGLGLFALGGAAIIAYLLGEAIAEAVNYIGTRMFRGGNVRVPAAYLGSPWEGKRR